MHALIALLIALASPAHGQHRGWQQPHNPHRVIVTTTWRDPAPTCTWVITGTIGSVPHCV